MTMIIIAFLLGLIIFLFGMSRLEIGIHDASRARLQRWLVRSTNTALSSAGSGVLLTAILQSSSMISLLVLAFASAGMIPLYNAIGIILGANLGTTFTGWLVTLIGFKLDLQQLAIPLMAAGGLIQMFHKNNRQKHALGIAVFGLGLLIFGLNLMKDSMANIPGQWDISMLGEHSGLVYLLAGTLLAALIQSSSATMMIALSALYSQIIALPEAAAFIIGADLGTTSTTVLGSLTGNRIKKQLALAHFAFNLVVDLAAFFVLLPLLPALLAIVALHDPLYSLVAFHSIFNLLGLACFLPFLGAYSRWIGQCFTRSETHQTGLVNIPVQVPEAAISALTKQIQTLLIDVLNLNMRNLHIHSETLHTDKFIIEQLRHSADTKQSFDTRYEAIKRQEGDIIQFVIRLQQQALSPQQALSLYKLLDTTRAMVYGCKTLKDISQNIADLRHASEAELLKVYKDHERYHRHFYQELSKLFLSEHTGDYICEQSENLKKANDQHHNQLNKQVFDLARAEIISGEETSTLFNINREIHHSAKSLISALGHWSEVSPNRHPSTAVNS